MKNVTDNEDIAVLDPTEENNPGCQARRKIEELLERKKTRDELGDFDGLFEM